MLDPVGAGATGVRREALRRLMGAGYFSVIKGNESELRGAARAVCRRWGGGAAAWGRRGGEPVEQGEVGADCQSGEAGRSALCS